MKLITQKNHLKIYLKNNYFDTPDLRNSLLEIINKAFITVDKKPHYDKHGGLNAWAFDFRIPLLNSALTKNLFPYISQYLSELGYDTIGLSGFGSYPFISLSQYYNIKNVLIARGEPKINGFKNEIEGIDKENLKKDPICLVDDLIHTGRGIQTANSIFIKNNINVNKYFCIANFTWANKAIDSNLIDAILEVHQ